MDGNNSKKISKIKKNTQSIYIYISIYKTNKYIPTSTYLGREMFFFYLFFYGEQVILVSIFGLHSCFINIIYKHIYYTRHILININIYTHKQP